MITNGTGVHTEGEKVYRGSPTPSRSLPFTLYTVASGLELGSAIVLSYALPVAPYTSSRITYWISRYRLIY